MTWFDPLQQAILIVAINEFTGVGNAAGRIERCARSQDDPLAQGDAGVTGMRARKVGDRRMRIHHDRITKDGGGRQQAQDI